VCFFGEEGVSVYYENNKIIPLLEDNINMVRKEIFSFIWLRIRTSEKLL
jgi:hypothetical protein